MGNFLGCLFILFFGIIFIIIAFVRMIKQLLFGTGPLYKKNIHQNTHTTHSSTSGNAHHERNHTNSRKRRSQKIFEKNEGEYIDFEDIPST